MVAEAVAGGGRSGWEPKSGGYKAVWGPLGADTSDCGRSKCHPVPPHPRPPASACLSCAPSYCSWDMNVLKTRVQLNLGGGGGGGGILRIIAEPEQTLKWVVFREKGRGFPLFWVLS